MTPSHRLSDLLKSQGVAGLLDEIRAIVPAPEGSRSRQ